MFNCIITNQTMPMLIWDCRQEYDNVFKITMPCYLTILILISTSPMCSCADEMLASITGPQ